MAEISLPGFNPDEVRAGLRLAMEVGLPVAPEDQPTFHFEVAPTPVATADSDGTPFAWDAERAEEAEPREPVKVPCAIEYADAAGIVEAVGPISSTRLVLTFLDEDYEEVKGFSYVVIGGNAYRYERTEPPLGLVSVGVWQVHVRADDEG